MVKIRFSMIRQAISGALDLIYPPQCIVCGQFDGDYLCQECRESIVRIEPPICRRCGVPCEEYLCRECRDRQQRFDYARSAGVFDGALREAIHAMKYRDCRMLAEPIAAIMTEQYARLGLPKTVDLVIPVPIDRHRMVERGFNQAADIAAALSADLGLRFDDSVLAKPKRTAHQVEISLEERHTNLLGAFRVMKPGLVVHKGVLLVDDVYTTGSTVNEAADALKNAGASEVVCYTSARSL